MELCYRHLTADWAELRVAAAHSVGLLLLRHRLRQSRLHAVVDAALVLRLRAVFDAVRSCYVAHTSLLLC
jgi:hypothetical protein